MRKKRIMHNALLSRAMRPWMNMAMDMVCCMLISMGILLAFVRIMPFEPAFPWAFAVMPAVLVLLLALCSLHKKISVLILEIAALGAVYACDMEAAIFYFRRFYTWWLLMQMPKGYEFGDGACLAVYWIIALLTVVLVWFFIRQVRRIGAMTLLCALLVLGLSLAGYGNHVTAVLLMASGLIPLMARCPAGRAKTAVPNGIAVLCAMPVAAICVIISAAGMRTDASAMRLAPLGEKVDSVYSDIKYEYQYRTTGSYGVSWTDQTPAFSEVLGGPNATGNTRVLTVKADGLYLLKGATFDTYDGHGWTNRKHNAIQTDAMSALAYYGGFMQHYGGAVGSLPEPKENDPLSDYVRVAEIAVTLYRPGGLQLYSTGVLTQFDSGESIMPSVLPDSALVSDAPMKNGAQYAFTTLVLDRNAAGFAQGVDEREPEISPYAQSEWMDPDDEALVYPYYFEEPAPEMRELSLFDYYSYTQIPDNDDIQDIRTLAESVAYTGQSRYQKALLLEAWLKTSFNYTLMPEVPPEDRDFVAHFLETKEGYCVYYATTMALMARMLGIPARYVTGYQLIETGNGEYSATTGNAHAWAELHFDGTGWITFDPTGAVRAPAAVAAMNELPVQTPVSMKTPDITQGGADAPESHGQGASASVPIFVWIAAAVAAVAIAIMLIVRLKYVRREGARQRTLTNGDILEKYFQDIRRQMELLGCRQLETETILRFAGRAAGELDIDPELMFEVARSVCELRYGGHMPAHEALKAAFGLREQLQERLQKHTPQRKRLRRALSNA